MSKHMTITVDADPDQDDCLAAAAEEAAVALRCPGYDMAPRWANKQRTRIALDVPTPGHNDARGWERLRAFDGYSGTHS